jgi:hypothetical protein
MTILHFNEPGTCHRILYTLRKSFLLNVAPRDRQDNRQDVVNC